MKYFHVLLIGLFFFQEYYASQFQSSAAGPSVWNNSLTWSEINPSLPSDDDGIPDEGDTITIRSGHTVNIPSGYTVLFLISKILSACSRVENL